MSLAEKMSCPDSGTSGGDPCFEKNTEKEKDGSRFYSDRPGGEISSGLLSGLWELPWTDDGTFPFDANWEKRPGKVRHIFTHLDLTLDFYQSSVPCPDDLKSSGLFVDRKDFSKYAFSTLMKKVLTAINIFSADKENNQ